jgi:hypothetical protein
MEDADSNSEADELAAAEEDALRAKKRVLALKASTTRLHSGALLMHSIILDTT